MQSNRWRTGSHIGSRLVWIMRDSTDAGQRSAQHGGYAGDVLYDPAAAASVVKVDRVEGAVQHANGVLVPPIGAGRHGGLQQRQHLWCGTGGGRGSMAILRRSEAAVHALVGMGCSQSHTRRHSMTCSNALPTQ